MLHSLQPAAGTCPLCHGTNIRSQRVRAFDVPGADLTVRRCTNCHLAWQWPIGRSAEESVAWFERMYYGEELAKSDYFARENKIAISRLELACVESIAPIGRLLDVGAGDGTFVELAAESGWNATGIEPSYTEEPGKPARPNATMIRGTFTDLPSGARFDAVTAWDVIEHVDDPADLLRASVAHLAPGGRLFVETGNFLGMGRIHDGADWWGFQLDHRWYFSPPVVEELFRRAGLEDIRLIDRTLRPDWTPPEPYHGPSRLQTARSVLRQPFRARELLEKHADLQRAVTRWKHFRGLGIFTMTGRLPDEAA